MACPAVAPQTGTMSAPVARRTRPSGRHRQPITATGDCDDPAVAQRLAQCGNLNLEIILLDSQAGPHLVEQRILADRLPGCRGKHGKNIKCPSADRDRDAVAGQASAALVEPEWAKLEVLLASRRHVWPRDSG